MTHLAAMSAHYPAPAAACSSDSRDITSGLRPRPQLERQNGQKIRGDVRGGGVTFQRVEHVQLTRKNVAHAATAKESATMLARSRAAGGVTRCRRRIVGRAGPFPDRPRACPRI